ncbi:ferredoxin [Arthrobacter sp. I2-34]|uniref:Ferredoxin n=1 Tax=Arthrobacter hankyongi TaxID=2904801 RepID=A0ABS9L9T4_9MICC|nr:ferredoxin [Arthrobacter hankyongi]MCG2623268.1 ferredoxin [Arthrobacter hankyongi]
MNTIDVDRSLCDNHGQCAIAAPAVFRMNAEGILEYEATVEDALLDEVEEAIDVCPVQAIFLKN